MVSAFLRGSTSTYIGCLDLSPNFSMPSSSAFWTESLKRVQRNKLWPKKPWNLQNTLFFLCSKGGNFRFLGTNIMPLATKRSKISSHLQTSKVYVLGRYLLFFGSSGFFPFDGLNSLHA